MHDVAYPTFMELVHFMYYGELRPIRADSRRCIDLLLGSYALDIACIRKALLERLCFLLHSGNEV